jgi:hypothetical protein
MKNQFPALQGWIPQILEAIKREIKSEHLPADHQFYHTHFGKRPLNRLTQEEIYAAYEKELVAGNEGLAEWVVNRWVFKHGDLYNHFAERLSEINPEFSEITSLTEAQSEHILDGAEENFTAADLYLFTVLNGVVFPEVILQRLRKRAEEERTSKKAQQEVTAEKQSLEKILSAHQREVARLNDKIIGVQKKYTTDTEALKKQIRALQQKLNAATTR